MYNNLCFRSSIIIVIERGMAKLSTPPQNAILIGIFKHVFWSDPLLLPSRKSLSSLRAVLFTKMDLAASLIRDYRGILVNPRAMSCYPMKRVENRVESCFHDAGRVHGSSALWVAEVNACFSRTLQHLGMITDTVECSKQDKEQSKSHCNSQLLGNRSGEWSNLNQYDLQD
jgi:hypothetical protein